SPRRGCRRSGRISFPDSLFVLPATIASPVTPFLPLPIGPKSEKAHPGARVGRYQFVSPNGSSSPGKPGHRRGHLEVGLVYPPAGIWGTVPALHGNGLHVLALLVVEHFQECLQVAGPDLCRGTLGAQQPVISPAMQVG